MCHGKKRSLGSLQEKSLINNATYQKNSGKISNNKYVAGH
jgi:hypothetical protein